MAIQIRRGNDAEWESNKSNIVAGEPAVTLDSERMFVGTGSGTYMELANLDVLADAFDSSATYAAGDYCTYGGKLYKFTTAHSGAWSSGDVEETLVTEMTPDGDALTEDVKQALLQIASKVAYIDEHGQGYYDALESALYPVASLVSISAVYTQSGTVYDTDSLDSLKTDLVVTAHFDDSSTEVVTLYTLSGTLTAGTSTITVAYGGKTTTFDVTVTHVMTLDDIAYGTLTYRDIFITSNKIVIGDFETTLINDADFHSAGAGSYYYKFKMAGTPSQTTEAYNSPTHSLKAFGTPSQQMFYKSDTENLSNGSEYLCCASVRVDRYVQGNAGIQIISPINNNVDKLELALQRVTDGFESLVGIYKLTANRTGWAVYIGSYTSANCDCYVDDVVMTPFPSGLTQEEALVLYNNYISIVKGVSA